MNLEPHWLPRALPLLRDSSQHPWHCPPLNTRTTVFMTQYDSPLADMILKLQLGLEMQEAASRCDSRLLLPRRRSAGAAGREPGVGAIRIVLQRRGL